MKRTPVLCRFRVNEKAEVEHWDKGHAFRVKLQGVKSEPFGPATPSANAEMLIVPKAAADQFEVGAYYLATFDRDPNQIP